MRHCPARKDETISLSELVKKCCDPAIHLMMERVRKMAKRARSYICTYHYLAQEMIEADNNRLAIEADQPQPQNEILLAKQQKLLLTATLLHHYSRRRTMPPLRL